MSKVNIHSTEYKSRSFITYRKNADEKKGFGLTKNNSNQKEEHAFSTEAEAIKAGKEHSKKQIIRKCETCDSLPNNNEVNNFTVLVKNKIGRGSYKINLDADIKNKKINIKREAIGEKAPEPQVVEEESNTKEESKYLKIHMGGIALYIILLLVILAITIGAVVSLI